MLRMKGLLSRQASCIGLFKLDYPEGDHQAFSSSCTTAHPIPQLGKMRTACSADAPNLDRWGWR